ncbi:hypothetical protein [Iningainema tapete]|uniref:TonB C-terminal domain-containing protein n=1 Tax=Iningainema tapete BLCC-T55 TaxID=2748662 RepID=A0A8J6XFE2_9CYAN|nr:hypothetical protein [Iningainema tapete]MBD2771582.1 hypothetical protein [Iningainema tapete BLCC-T55]
MSYVSLLKNIPDFLSQPTGIAAIASVGIHGAIAFFLPLMPMESSKPKQQSIAPKTVGLLELNQSLQNRLPQPTPQIPAKLPVPPQQPQISLQPQVPMPSLNAQMAPVPPLPPALSQATLPPIPKSPSNLSVASLPKGQSLQILPIKPSISTTNPIALSKPKTVGTIPSINNNPVKLAGSNSLSPYKLSPIQREVKLGASKPLPPSNLPELEAAKMPTDLPNTPSPMPIAAAPPSDVGTNATNNDTTVIPPQNQQLVAPVGETPQAGDTLALAEAGITPSQGSSSVTPELPSTATQQVVAKNTTFGERYNEVKRQYPNIETKLPISETVNSKVGQPGNVQGSLIVDSEGKVESIDFLNNSVSSDQKAAAREYFREYFQKNPVQATGKPKYYPFSLSFRSNNTDTPVVIQPSGSSRTEKTPRRSNTSQRSIVIPRLPSTPVNPQELEAAPTNLTEKLRTSSRNITPTSVQQTANRSSVEPISKPSTQLRVRRELQPTPQVETSSKPSTQLQVRPTDPTPQVETSSKPSTQLRVRRLEPTPQVETISKPSTQLQVRPTDPTPQVEATNQPLAQLRERKNQSAAALQPEQPTEKPSSESEVNSNQPSSPSGKQKLLRQLRELREQRQTTN